MIFFVVVQVQPGGIIAFMAVKETLWIRLERYFQENYLPKRDQSIIGKKTSLQQTLDCNGGEK